MDGMKYPGRMDTTSSRQSWHIYAPKISWMLLTRNACIS